MPRPLAVGLLVFCAALASAQLTENERIALEETLYIGNLKPSDLNQQRIQFPSIPVPGLVASGINDPLKTADELLALHASALPGLPSATLASALGLTATPLKPVAVSPPSTALPPVTAAVVRDLTAVMAAADLEIREALVRLTPVELRSLIESLPVLAAEEPKLKFSFVRSPSIGLPACAALLDKVDLTRIHAAGLAVQAATEAAYTRLRECGETIPAKVRIVSNNLPVVVCGTGDDTHTEVDARLTIDLGGNDKYQGRHGAGVGYASVLIDLDGDDSYTTPDLSLGAGVFGVGCALDGGGSDTFRCGSVSLGCGIGGTGVFYKRGGHDSYSAPGLTQGFAVWGVGLLIDTAGDDTYRTRLWGQGAARTDSLAWLVDKQGNDIYEAGGLSLNSPLFTNVHYSFAQGFGMGFREDTGGEPGGTGLLTDFDGYDHYISETYAQAASYWLALGSLYDAEGNDSYVGHHYVQASAMHMTGAYLFDLDGHDSYTVKFGAAQAIGHDYSTAFFLDRAGDDIYAAKDARPGTGVANGVGIFIEAAGSDTYTCLPAFGREDRSMPSLGVFADLKGADKFPAGMTDTYASIVPSWGIAYDQADTAPGTGVNQPETVPDPAPGSAPVRPASEMQALYAKATQWGVGSAQAEVEQSVRDLIAIGVPAWQWMLDNRLKDANRLHIRAFVRVVKACGPDAIAALGAKALAATDAELAVILRIATDGGIQDVGALLPGIIKNKPALKMQAVRAVGALKAVGATDALLPVLLEKDPLLRRAAIQSLSIVGDKAAIGTASSMLGDPDPIVREMAVRLIVRFPEEGVAIGKTLVTDVDETKARLGLQILAKINMFASLEEVAKYLSDPRPGMRVSSLLLLEGKCPESGRQQFESLKQDPVPLVRAVAHKVKP